MKNIICIPQGGLCNRMRAIASVVELSKHYAIAPKIVIIWIQSEELNAPFQSLFEPFDATILNIKSNFFTVHLIGLFLKLWKSFRGKIITLPPDIFTEDWLYSQVNQNLVVYTASKIIPFAKFDFFVPSSLVRNSINKQIGREYVGVHIRRTDNIQSILNSPTELFVQQIENEICKDDSVKVYLATDDPNEENILRNKFGNRIVTYIKRSLDRNCEMAIVDAVVDLFHLSQCKCILGSYYSSFSETAAEWGNVEYNQITTKQ